MSVFIQNIKQLDAKFNKIRLENVVYTKGEKTLEVNFLLHCHFDNSDVELLRKYISEKLPFATVSVRIKKVVCDADLVANRVSEFIVKNCIPVKERVKNEDIKVKIEDEKAIVCINAESEVCSYLQTKNFESSLIEYLEKFFCEEFTVKYDPRKNEDTFDVLAEEKIDYTRIEAIPARYYKVNNVTRLFDNNSTDTVMYIADARERTGEIAIAGKVIGLKQKETKKGKPFYVIDFNDGTGRMSGSVFCTKETFKKMQKIQEGSEVVAVGEAQVYEGFHRYTIKSLNFCEFPKDFKYEERASRKPPEYYLLVSPSEVEGEMKQTDMFSVAEKTPECLIGKSFVVLDIETTGTSANEDRVTEIGAVKIIDGKIIEKFVTFVNPERKIPEEVVNLTGINDEMVENAPVFKEIAGDFYKFCYGSIIVAHNINFDYTFIKRLSKPCDYVYGNRGIDTLALSRKLLPNLSNHKLNTVCEHFGIEFLHHRAYSDALATANMFIELVKMNGEMPEFDV